MLKLLLLVFAVWLIVTIIKRYQHQTHTPPPTVMTGNMVQCAICSVHIPENEAISMNGLHYCCEAHFLQRKQQ